ncbi:hypothetical protein IFR05_001244 [Cadophora sp. M221]|nr:hypothetical protein IFR05_001244 [Cadophora sp. M221]
MPPSQSVSKSKQKASESYTLNSYHYSAPSVAENLSLDPGAHGGTNSMSSDLQNYVDGLGNVIERDADKKKKASMKL